MLPREQKKLPRVFTIESLSVERITLDKPLDFEAILTNPIPRGEIRTKGRFGPWVKSVSRTRRRSRARIDSTRPIWGRSRASAASSRQMDALTECSSRSSSKARPTRPTSRSTPLATPCLSPRRSKPAWTVLTATPTSTRSRHAWGVPQSSPKEKSRARLVWTGGQSRWKPASTAAASKTSSSWR